MVFIILYASVASVMPPQHYSHQQQQPQLYPRRIMTYNDI